MSKQTVSIVTKLVAPLIEEKKLTLWDLRFEKEGSMWMLRVIIDKEDGIDINDCESLSRSLDKLLDEADPIDQSYCLEVSSAGLERELTKDWHFDFSVGKTLEIKLIRAIDDKREFIGQLKSYCNKIITLIVDNQEVNINFDDTAYVRWYFEI